MDDAERLRLRIAIRRAEDPCWQMELTPTQRQVMECQKRYIAVRGQNRGGKTALSACLLSRCARRLPGPKTTDVRGVYVVFAPSRSQIADPWAKKLLKGSELKGHLFDKPFIPQYEIEHVRYTYGAGEPTVNLIELKNGNCILFCVSGDKNVWKRIEGKGCILGCVLDESAGSEQLLEELMTRLLDANSNEQVVHEAGGAWVIWGATQTKKSPAFERFLALGESGENEDYAAFSLVPGENPAIDQNEREKMAAIMSKESYEIRMLGHGSAAGGMALYPQWDDDRNLVPKGQEYVPGPDDNLWVFYDPGTHYTGIVFAAINRLHPSRINVVSVAQPQRTTLEYDAKLIRSWLGGRWLEGFVYDQAARKTDKTGATVAGALWRLFNAKGTDVRMHRGMQMGKSEYSTTVPLMRTYLRPVSGEANIILNRGDGCDLLRWQIMNCAFKENSYDLKEDNVQKGNDHCSDALRYGCSRMPVWVDRGLNPKLWGPDIGPDPDADRQTADPTASDGRYQFAPQPTVDESVTPAQRMRREAVAQRERKLRKQRSVW